MDQIDIDPLSAGIITLGFIYGAYFTETFRGAFMIVPKGQIEAAIAYGFSPWQIFRIILFPQMMRFALPLYLIGVLLLLLVFPFGIKVNGARRLGTRYGCLGRLGHPQAA